MGILQKFICVTVAERGMHMDIRAEVDWECTLYVALLKCDISKKVFVQVC